MCLDVLTKANISAFLSLKITSAGVIVYFSASVLREKLHVLCASLCQTSVDGLRAASHKKKLWNSLELSNTLTVENVTVDHTGEFICTASSGQMEKTASAFLKVYGGCTENNVS